MLDVSQEVLAKVTSATGWDEAIAKANIEEACSRLDITPARFLEYRLFELDPFDQEVRYKHLSDPSGSMPWTFTLAQICRIVGIEEIPEPFKARADEVLSRVDYASVPKINLSKYRGAFFDRFPQRSKDSEGYQSRVKMIQAGGIVFTPVTYEDQNGNPLPTIQTDDVLSQFANVPAYMKKILPMPSLAITGSAGKSTSILMAYCVFNEKFNVYLPIKKTYGNSNGAKTITKNMIDRYTPEFNFIINEIGAGSTRLVESMADAMRYDAFGITNIDPHHHEEDYRSGQTMVEDKTSFDKYTPEGGVAVLNADDAILMGRTYQTPVVTFGIESEDADYVGKNIVQADGILSFDVDDHDHLTHIEIEIPGKHNVYNALLVFALARHFGVTDEQIVSGFKKYKSQGTRQAIRHIKERTLYIDCYSGSSESIVTACRSLGEMKTTGRKAQHIAVVGGETRLGNKIESANFETGKRIAACPGIDYFVFVGPDKDHEDMWEKYGCGKAVYEGARTIIPEKSCTFIAVDENGGGEKELIRFLREKTNPGDIILFEGSHRLNLDKIAEKAFDYSAPVKQGLAEKLRELYHGLFK